MSDPSRLFSTKLFFLLIFVSFLGMGKVQAIDEVTPGGPSQLKVAARNTGVSEAPASASHGERAQGGKEPSAQADPRLKTYLALHCQAVLGLALRDFGGPYGSTACGDGERWEAVK